MDILLTYQQDTTQVKSLIKTLPQVEKTGKLTIDRTPVVFKTIQVREPAPEVKDTVPPPPTYAQIRYWRWLRESKMLIDGSRYIQPQNDVKLVSSVKTESSNIELPIHEINKTNTDWITILLLLVIALFATVRNTYSKYIVNLFRSLVNYPTSFRLFREKNYPILHGAFRLEAFFYITFSIFLYQVIEYFQLTLAHENLSFYIVGLAMVFFYFFIKKISYTVLGLVFEGTSETSEYLFNLDIYNRTLGLVLFPIVVLINYYPSENLVFIVFAGIFTVAVFYVFLLQRGIYILLKKQFPIFYLFLYLCTLEFVPLFLIYKGVVL